jgi:hypothetical protein
VLNIERMRRKIKVGCFEGAGTKKMFLLLEELVPTNHLCAVNLSCRVKNRPQLSYLIFRMPGYYDILMEEEVRIFPWF